MVNPPAQVVVIGAGLGGLRTVEQLRAASYEGRVTLVGAEPHAPYDRPPLSKQILTGAWEPDRAVLRDEGKLQALEVDLRLGAAATGLRDGVVELADGTRLDAGAVVIATGAHPRRLPGQPDGVHLLRSLDDALALRKALSGARSLLIIGGGFIGAEVASAALGQGIEVTVLEAAPVPCERALGARVGELCARLAAEAGATLRVETSVERFVDEHTVELASGERLTADAVLAGIGAAPSLEWLRGGAVSQALDARTGLVCDARGRVAGASGVWAVGDVAAWEDPSRGAPVRCEHWTNAADQAAVVARDIVGAPLPPPTVPYVWSDQFGLKIQVVGTPELADSVLPLRGEGLSGGPVKGTVAGYFAGESLVGVAGFGAARYVARYRGLVAKQADRAEVLAVD